jgi:hypothetical protein
MGRADVEDCASFGSSSVVHRLIWVPPLVELHAKPKPVENNSFNDALGRRCELPRPESADTKHH